MASLIEVQINVADALTRLGAASTAALNLKPVLGTTINASIDQLFDQQFDSEGAYLGSRWAPLAPVTVKLRQRRGHGRGGILRDTNRLWASLTKLGQGPDALIILTDTSIERGTKVPYAQWQQTGFLSKTFVVVDKNGNAVPLRRKTPKQIPARPIVTENIPADVLSGWQTAIANFIASGGALRAE